MIKSHNTIRAYSIPDCRNWPQTGITGEDEGDNPPPACENVIG